MKTCTIKPAVNQVESHPFLPQTKELAWLTANGIVMTAYSPLGSPDRPARLVEEADPAPLHDETVLAIAAKHGKEAAQVLIRWQVQRGAFFFFYARTPILKVHAHTFFSLPLPLCTTTSQRRRCGHP